MSDFRKKTHKESNKAQFLFLYVYNPHRIYNEASWTDLRKGERIFIAQKLDLLLYGLLFYTLNKEDTRRVEWTLIRKGWGLIILGVLWLVPLLILNVWYGITITGCSSSLRRVASAPIPHLNLAARRPLWYVDLCLGCLG